MRVITDTHLMVAVGVKWDVIVTQVTLSAPREDPNENPENHLDDFCWTPSMSWLPHGQFQCQEVKLIATTDCGRTEDAPTALFWEQRGIWFLPLKRLRASWPFPVKTEGNEIRRPWWSILRYMMEDPLDLRNSKNYLTIFFYPLNLLFLWLSPGISTYLARLAKM